MGVFNKMAKKRIKNGIKNLIYLAILLFLFLNFRVSRVVGDSMRNTYYDGDILICCELDQMKPEYGDIVVFSKGQEQHYLIKRVIGVANDTIEIQGNTLFINNNEIEESYIKEPMETDDGIWTVPEGHIFVLGDNRNDSLDSRDDTIGFINLKDEYYGKIIIDLSDYGVTYENLYVKTIEFILVIGIAMMILQLILAKIFKRKEKEKVKDE